MNGRDKIYNDSLHNERIDKLIYINNIIESMSNARTIKNNNSSRCGRINDLIFEERENTQKGESNNMFNYCFNNIKIVILLLEINRCIRHNKGERNFHIFYQVLYGLSDKQLYERNLVRNIHHYHILNCDKENDKDKYSNDMSIDNINNDFDELEKSKDEKNFKLLLDGLTYIKYDSFIINQFFDVIGGILHLGQIIEENIKKDNYNDKLINTRNNDKNMLSYNTCNDKTNHMYSDSYKYCSECLSINLEDLQNIIKYKNINVSSETIRTHRNKENMTSTIYTIIKIIYKNFFNKIIRDINIAHLNEKEKEEIMNEHIYMYNHNIISIFDIYGFEELSFNDFDQLCINLANEKLNNYYINNEIEKEKIIYQDENIFCNNIEVPNYKDTLIFIDKILSNLDDITKLHNSGYKKSDDHFFNYLLNNEKMIYLEKKNVYGFISNKDQAHTNKKQNIKKNQFFINHYAGPITYTINNWIYKNSDKIELDIENLIKNSKNYFLNENEHNKVQGISNDTNHQQENNMSNMHAVTQEKNNYINLKKDHMSDYVEKKMDTEEKICNMDNMMIGKTGEFVFLNEQENIWGDRCVPIIQGDEKKKRD